MFSTHEVVHMSKCSKEGHRRCAVHGEQYIMFSNTQKTMLCVNCFRDTPAEARLHCVDIDTAYTQGCKKLDRAVMSVCDLQNSVREGLLMFKTLLEELRRNMESEKHTINSFCQGMQEAIAKTHANMIMEVQRQFETKERQFRGQLISLGTVLPLLQLHLLLCSTFSSSANKYQFLDLAYPMMDRLAAVSQLSQPPRPVQSSQIRTNYRSEFSHALEPWVGKSVISATQQQQAGGEMGPQVSGTGLYEPPQVQQPHQPAQPQHGGSQTSATQHFHPPPSRRQHSALRAKALEGEGPFSNHCRSFDSQIKELSQQLCGVKERLGELHRDVTLLRRAHTPPLAARYEHVTRECAVLEEQLERHQVELERLKNIFDTLWEEQLCRIHVEQEIFQSQMNDILTLRAEVKHLSLVAHQLEPYVKALTASERNQASSDALQQQQQQQETTSSHQQLQSLLEHISMLQFDAASSYRIDSSGTQKGECRVHPGQVVTSPTAENIMYMKVDGKEAPVREMSRARGTSSREQQQVTGAMLDVSGSGVGIYGSRQQQAPAVNQNLQNVDTGRDGKRGVLSQLIEKVRTKEDRKKSPVQEEARVLVGRERSKSDGRGSSGSAVVEGGRTKLASGQQGDDSRSQGAVGGGKGAAVRTSKGESSAQRYVSAAPSRESSSSKVASLYHTISGKVLGSRDSSDRADAVSALEMSAQGSITSHHHLPPPPPPTTSRRPQSHHEDITSSEVAGCLDVRERLEAHLKEKLHEMMGHRLIRPSSVGEKGIDSQAAEESEYQRISEATTSPVAAPDGTGVTKQAVRAMIHREPSTAASTPTSPHRHRGEHQGTRKLHSRWTHTCI